MPKRTSASPLAKKVITISRKNYDRILMWCMSEKETQFLCFGNGKSIKKVARLTNIAKNPKNYTQCSEKDYKSLIKAHKNSGLKIIAFGHSHPAKYHCQHPSRTDVYYSEAGEIWLIGFPYSNTVRGWIMSSTLDRTKKNEVEFNIV